MGYNFATIDKSSHYAGTMQGDKLRLTNTYLAIGEDTLPSARKGSNLGVRVDAENQAIYLFRDDMGYTVQENSDSYRTILPGKRLRDAGLQIGDYLPDGENPGVYVRAMGKTE